MKSVLLIFGLAVSDNAQVCSKFPFLKFSLFLKFPENLIWLQNIFPNTEAKDNPCDEDWTFDGVDGCWSVIKNHVDFNDAKNACTAKGATLGVPNDLIVDTVVS